jgi:HK97 family phage portal protein
MATAVLQRIGEALRSYWNPPRSLRDPRTLDYLLGTVNQSSTTTATWTTPAITEASALRYPAIWAAVQCIAGDVASLPFFHYKRLAVGGKERATTSRLYRVLHDEFNPEMTAFTGRETMTAHVLLWGNAYAEIVRNDLGQVTQLWPIEPNRVTPDRNDAGAIIYRVQTGDGTEAIVPAERILHLVGLGFNGLMGYSVIAMQRDALSVGASAENLGRETMARGAKYSGFFQHPSSLGATAHKHLKEAIASDLPGTYRILEEGMTYVAGSMPLADAQFMEIRKFSVTEVARIFGIPPHKLGDLERATFSNIEEQNIDYVMWTLRRWLVRWEKECNRKLIPPLEKSQQFCEHLIDGATRGNIASRYGAYSIGRNIGVLSANDIREYENLNPLEDGGDVYLVQSAMVPLDRLNELVDAQIVAKQPPEPAPPADETEEDDAEAEDGTEAAMRQLAQLVGDLRAELERRAALAVPPPLPLPDLEGLRTEMTLLTATVTQRTEPLTPILAAVTQPPPEPPAVVVAPGLDAEALAAHLAPVRDAIDAAQHATVAELSARLATEAELRAWREATFALIAGKLVRRELAQLKKREADPATAAMRLEAFYRRFIGDGLTELRPWLLRLPAPEARELAATRVLTQWAEAAMATCASALTNGGLGDVLRHWEIDRAAGLARALSEVMRDDG